MATIKYLILIIIIIGIGAGTYFYGYYSGREKEILTKRQEITDLQKRLQNKTSLNSQPDNAIKGVTEDTTTDKDQTTTNPEEEFEEYIVQDKDTLFTIGLKFDMTWEKIAKANNLEENSQLYIGQKLKIPKPGSKSIPSSIDVEINEEEARKQQKLVTEQNTDLWRLDPIDVVRREAPANLNLLPGDPYSLLSKDVNNSTAKVFVEKNNFSYTFHLVQPVDKGEDGIWKIEKIEIKPNE